MQVALNGKTHHVDIYVDGITLSQFPSGLAASQFSVWVDGAMAAFFVDAVFTNCSDFTDEQIITLIKEAINEGCC